jgi:nucleoid DNA-binding protein
MDKKELVERLAKRSHCSKGHAADQVDMLVYGLLKELKEIPGKGSKPVENRAPKPSPDSSSGSARSKK